MKKLKSKYRWTDRAEHPVYSVISALEKDGRYDQPAVDSESSHITGGLIEFVPNEIISEGTGLLIDNGVLTNKKLCDIMRKTFFPQDCPSDGSELKTDMNI